MTRPTLTALAAVLALAAWPAAAQTDAQTDGQTPPETAADAPAESEAETSVETPAETSAETPAETETESVTPAAPALETTTERYSYGLGLQIGQTLRQQGIDEGLDPSAFTLGIRDYFEGIEPRLGLEEIQEAYSAMQAVFAQQAEAASATALAEGAAFLATNADEEGVETTESGLQYRVVESGDPDGPQPTPEDQVRVHYEGQLLNGQIFDSSYQREEPAEFGVGQVIEGWQQILQQMRPGDIWEVWIPPQLAYGERGAGGQIGPNEVLRFRIELIEILEAE